MRSIVSVVAPVLALVLLGTLVLPSASAEIGVPKPCRAGVSFYWPGENVGLNCTVAGREIVAFSLVSQSLGWCVILRVAGYGNDSCA